MKFMKILLCFIILILFLPLVFSNSAYFGIKLDCLENCNDRDVDVSKQIMLKLEITNDFDYWIGLGTEREYDSPDLRITVENTNLQNGKDVHIYNNILGGTFFLQPKDIFIVYLPFEIYNNLDVDNRLGEWKITPEFLTNNVKYFKNPYNGEQILNVKPEFQIPSNVKGNVLKFESKKEEVEVKVYNNPASKTSDAVKSFFDIWGGYIIAGIIIGLVLLVAGIILKKNK